MGCDMANNQNVLFSRKALANQYKMDFLASLAKLPSTQQQAIKKAIHVLANQSPKQVLSVEKRDQFIQLVQKLLRGESIVSQHHPSYQCKHCIHVSLSMANSSTTRLCAKQGAHIYMMFCPFWQRATGSDDELTGVCHV
jgi:hypothetical protein